MAFVYCPNPKCWAKAGCDEGYSWRFVYGGTQPKNCRQCYTAFKLGPQYQKKGGGSFGRKPTQSKGEQAQQTGSTVRGGEKKSADAAGDRVQFIPAECGSIRKWLLTQHKDKAEALAAVDIVAPQKPLTAQEHRDQLQERLEKSNKQYLQGCKVAEEMGAKQLRLAKALNEQTQKIEAQAEELGKKKSEKEKLQAEWDALLASEPASMESQAGNDDTATVGLVARTLAKYVDESVSAQHSAAMGRALKELATSAEFSAIRQKLQGGPQHQQQQQQQFAQPAVPASSGVQLSDQELQQQIEHMQRIQHQRLQAAAEAEEQHRQQVQAEADAESLRIQRHQQEQERKHLEDAAAAAEELARRQQPQQSQQQSPAIHVDADMPAAEGKSKRNDRQTDEDDFEDVDEDTAEREPKRFMLPGDGDSADAGNLASESTLYSAKRIAAKLLEANTVESTGQTVHTGGSRS